MVPKPNQNLIENGATPTNNYYRGGEPDKPVSTCTPAASTTTSRAEPLLLPGVRQHVHRAGERLDLRGAGIRGAALDRSVALQLGGDRQLDARAGKTVIDSQVASNRFFQDDLLRRLHEYKPSDMGMPGYLDAFCAAQNDCMLPAVNIGGYQGISQGAVSGDRTTNLQGTVNFTQVRGAHTLRGGVDARLAQRQRGLGGNPSSQLSFTNEFTRQASDTVAAHAEQPRAEPGGVHAGHPVDVEATIQPTINLRNHFFAVYAQDSWRLQNLTLNLGLRVEWENGISEDNGELIVDFDPNAKLAISDLAEAAYARAPIPQLPARTSAFAAARSMRPIRARTARCGGRRRC